MKKYQIFQISDNSVNGRYVKFSSYELVEDMGIKLSLDMYDKVYEGEVEERETIYDTLESIFVFLNIGKKPEDYRGHSLSVSDVILMDGVYYYVDGMGFQEVRMAKAAPAVYTVMIFNERSMKRERKNFKREDRDGDRRKSGKKSDRDDRKSRKPFGKRDDFKGGKGGKRNGKFGNDFIDDDED